MRKNMGTYDAYWRMGTGALALLWASRRRRGPLLRSLASVYGVVSLAEGILRYDPLLAAFGMSTQSENEQKSHSSWDGEWVDETSADHVPFVDEDDETEGPTNDDRYQDGYTSETILQIGNLRLQRVPRANKAPTLWGVVRRNDGFGYEAPVSPEGEWDWENLDDRE